MARKAKTSVSKGIAVIGSSVAAIQTAHTLAQLGVEVIVVTDSAALGWNGTVNDASGNLSPDQRYLWPLLLRLGSHPLVTLYTNADVTDIEGQKGDFRLRIAQRPRYIREELCTSCGRCQAECSARVTSLIGSQKITHGAIHSPLIGARTVPSAYVIDRDGSAPCHVACPLGINVPGFVSLLANGKIDKALALINGVAPFAGILGRVCKSPCEDNCNRVKIDSSVSIRALHRYAADNTSVKVTYQCKLPPRSREERIAIVGSGPAGLTAAWELARRGYSPTVFESHSVIGGMLATGIPRFRLPREIREREIAAIKELGVDIRTGITVGRDVTFAYLKERGYRTFFLGIGAQQNNKLGLPGEELDGVVDCMSLLLTLNLMVDTFVGSNIVVIGDGNSAIDSARTAIRKNKGSVKVLSWTIPEDITAIKEEVAEALQEGVTIEYLAVPVEVLGEEGKVCGLHCQRTKLTDEIMANGHHRPEPIPGTDFIMAADHVVVAIGQSPDTSQLRMEGLTFDSNTGVIKVNPLTLETSLRGVFAGGDCISGPNNVVEAMAAGLRAAESIDRHLQGHDLEEGRSLEPPPIAEIDAEMIEVLPYKRASMPVIRAHKRLNSFEETTTGLSSPVAQMEAQRCLNCAWCSQCMECASVCELGAIFHDDAVRHFEVEAQSVLSFTSVTDSVTADSTGQDATREGIRLVSLEQDGELADQITRAMAIALETAIEVKPGETREDQGQGFAGLATDLEQIYPDGGQLGTKRIGVFLCSCGGSISSVIDFKTVTNRLPAYPGVTYIREVAQACTEAGAREIVNEVAEWQLEAVVLAACRCCNLEQVCFSCTDRRIKCQYYLNQHLILPHKTVVEFCNIREQCAWIHNDDPRGATRKAVQIISSGVARARLTPAMNLGGNTILPKALVIGSGPVSISAAGALAARGYQVELVARQDLHQSSEIIAKRFEQIGERKLIVRPWPDGLKLHGSPGRYEAVLEYGSQVDQVTAGALLVDTDELSNGEPPLCKITPDDGLLGRILSRTGHYIGTGDNLLREVTIKETSGIFLLPANSAELLVDQTQRGLAAAARVSAYLEPASLSPRALAVYIDDKRCRGCGNCSDICPYIEMRVRGDGTVYAYLDKVLCLGCGACITTCPSGAITQPLQSDRQLVAMLRTVLHSSRVPSGV